MEGEKIEYSTKKDDDGYGNHQRANKPVDENDAIDLETAADFVDQPCESIPPQYGARYNAQIAYCHDKGVPRDDKRKLSETCHEQQDDQWVGNSYEKGGDTIVYQCAFYVAALVHVLCGIGAVTENAERQQHQASQQLQVETVFAVVHDVHHETHAHTRNQCVEQVACRGTYAGDKAIPTALVQRTLNTKDTYRPHGSGHEDPDNQTLDDGVYNIDVESYWHIVCKIAKKM